MLRRRIYAATVIACLILFGTIIIEAQFGVFFGSRSSVDTIGTKELHSILLKQRNRQQEAEQNGNVRPESHFVVVDVRSEAEVAVSVIPGAITKAEYEKDQAKYENKVAIVYCTVGGRSGRYAEQLKKKGVDVKNYQGSILEWVQAELPLVTLDGKPTNRVHTYSDQYKIPAQYHAVTE